LFHYCGLNNAAALKFVTKNARCETPCCFDSKKWLTIKKN